MKWFIYSLKNIFTYKGRARRAEFGWFTLTNFFIMLGVYLGSFFIVVLPIIASVGQKSEKGWLVGIGISVMIVIALIIMYHVIIFFVGISLTARRLHDLGLSGWWQLLPITIVIVLSVWIYTLPIFDQYPQNKEVELLLNIIAGFFINIPYSVFALVLIFKDGQRCTNRFGEDPKAVKLPIY